MVATKIKKILLIDDDEISNFINERRIRNAGIADQVSVCVSGINAIQLLKELLQKNEQRPEVILLDINMPVMDGFGFLDEFMKFPEPFINGVKIAMLTSSLEKEEIKRSFEYKNVIDFINKPLSTQKIESLITKIY